MATNTYVALKSTTVTGSPVSSVTLDLTGITGYTDLVLVVQGRFDSANQIREFRLRFNGDTGTNYSSTRMIGDGSSASSDRLSNFSNMRFGVFPAATATAGVLGNAICHIQNYANTSVYKTVLNRTNDSQGWVVEAVGLWRNTAAITSIDVAISETQTGNWVVGSTFTLYGIAAASVGAKATGGTIYQDASYFYHVFAGNGTFTPSQSISADVLVVAGGGAGGSWYAGGGGAGGLCHQSARSLSSSSYTVTIGAGGASSTPVSGINGLNGTNSTFDTITAIGGGGGAGWLTAGTNGLSGGSGGGGSMGTSTGNTTSGGAATQGASGGATGYGNAGGGGYRGSSIYLGGGGGGAGAAAVNANVSTKSPGGVGLDTWSSWASATGTGDSGYFAGGGGGSVEGSGFTQAAGGLGGGGAGGIYSGSATGVNGMTNTGGGGGATQQNSPTSSGGSGIVIVRYAK